MLRKRILGGTIHEELWGIDNAALRSSIQRTCLWRSSAVAPAMGLLIVLGICARGMVEVLMRLLRWDRSAQEALWLLVMALVCFAAFRVWRRLALKALPEVLRSLERCSFCGYKLNSELPGRCPECGRPFERSVLTDANSKGMKRE